MNAGREPGKVRAQAAAWAMGGILLLAAAPAAFAHRVERKFDVSIRPVVMVHNDNGRITVKSWQKNEIQVVSEHASDKVEVDVEQRGNRIDITTHVLNQSVTPAELKADFEISVPEETELQIRNDAGMVVVERVSGDLTFETVLADVKLEEVAGYLVVKTVSGSLVCVRCAGRIEVNSISGNLRLIQPISPNVRAQTYSGSIFFDGDFLPGGAYVLKNHRGPIEVRYTESDSFDLRATSIYGKVDREPSLTLTPPSHERRTTPGISNSLFGTFNSGAARVELTSFSGTISIRKR
ncbi:MAG: hypothetical protein HY234_15630 [Acidobacteria bacterium]|nr:hypothetical protein [Acidobacteriota bacterium]MBI3664465.1 hypothetical protein [Acidobacteriota bacterium]